MEKGILITLETIVQAPVARVWKFWTNPEDILCWNHASDDWHTTRAENDLKPGGKFLSRMEAKDGSFGFDFWGVYDQVVENQLLASTLGDGRKLTVSFEPQGDKTKIVESFEAESVNSVDLQRVGWQTILNNFKKYIESAT
jgi:uncharacterized protein YndB with AHSA1/START domain